MPWWHPVFNNIAMSYLDRLNPDHPSGRLLYSGKKFLLKDPAAPKSPIPLCQKADNLFKYLLDNDFTETYTKCMRNMYEHIRKANTGGGIDIYNSLLKSFPNQRPIIARWLVYDLYDILPQFWAFFPTVYDHLSEHYRSFIDDGMRSAIGCGLQNATINVEASVTAAFFKFIQDKGIEHIQDVDERTVQSYILTGHGAPLNLYRVGHFIKRHAEAQMDNDLMKVTAFFPKEVVMKKVYPAFTSDERRRLEEYILDDNCPLSKRDRAIVAMLLYMGMRSQDVRNLMMESIDWAKKTIRFVQGKTGKTVVLPIRPFVGNCLSDYINNERPRVDSPYCFLSMMPYGGEYVKCSIQHIVNHTYEYVGIRTDGGRRGTHLLRHSFADEMMNAGCDISVVADALGHKDPNTTLGYLSANTEQLRACSLSIESFPVHHKLYCHE